MNTDFFNQFAAARMAGTPLICIRTPDPAALVDGIMEGLGDKCPSVLRWDVVRGLRGVNPGGKDAFNKLGISDKATIPPVNMLINAEKIQEESMIFVSNAHRIMGEMGVPQAIWNLRDIYKADGSTLILMCPDIVMPTELAQDVLVMDEPLPSNADLGIITKKIYESAGIKAPTDAVVDKAVDAICGLASFPAEQALAMSIRKEGLNLAYLWERKRVMIEDTPGLSVYRGKDTFLDIGGCDNVKMFMSRVINGKESPRAIVFVDEIEKQFAGSSGLDTSGVSTEMVGTLLPWMQDHNARGVIFIGPPGAAKSAVAKATGNTGGIPTISFDLTGMKASLVGESGARLRRALKVVDAVSQGRSLFVATCNRIGILPPELRRRFTLGTFFFDLPTKEERKQIWKIWLTSFKLTDRALPDDEGWTGAEIKQCCDLAYQLDCTLVEAASYIIPVSKSAADSLELLREQADGNFISANYPGPYLKDAPKSKLRKVGVN